MTTTTTLELPGRYGPVPLPDGAIAVMTETGRWITDENEAKRLSHDNPLMWVSACTVTHAVTVRAEYVTVSVTGTTEALLEPERVGKHPYRYRLTARVEYATGEVRPIEGDEREHVERLREPMTVADLKAAVDGMAKAIMGIERHRP